MSFRTPIALSALLLAACSSPEPVPPKEFEQLLQDPVFSAAMRDPEFRRQMRDPGFWQAMRNPQFRRQLRGEYSELVYPLPSSSVLARVERQLVKDPCVGSLDKWNRQYTNGTDARRGGIDPNKVQFSLREAGVFEFGPGRSVVRAEDYYRIDDRPYRVVVGTYDIAADQLTIETCGPNAPK